MQGYQFHILFCKATRCSLRLWSCSFCLSHYLVSKVFILFCTGKCWKRMVTKVTYVGDDFTRKPPKYERFIRPMVKQFFLEIFQS